MKNTIIAVDFDGTVVTHQYPYVENPVPGALTWMRAEIFHRRLKSETEQYA